MCELLAEDYADRASRNGMKYDDAFRQYTDRCMSRSEIDLQKQIKVQGLKKKLTGFVNYAAI